MPAPHTSSRRRFLAASALTLAAVPLGTFCTRDGQPGPRGSADPPAADPPSDAPAATKDGPVIQQMTPSSLALPREGAFPMLDGATGWLNSAPLTPEGLLGKVVLVEFWTYTCINWLRTLPYVRAWSEKYRDHGLVTIGVHTPEFAFEHDVDNIRRAVADMKIAYPVAIDSGYKVWQAFANHYWPALYLVDATGQIRYHRFGEGDYERSEMVLQQLLAAAGSGGFDRSAAAVEGQGAEAAADWANLKTPETYVGSEQAERFASPGGAAVGRPKVYSVPDRLGLNQWALAGDWTVDRASAVSNEADGRIAYRFHARDLHLVMGPARRGASVRFRVTLDGQAPGDAHGVDTDEQGYGILDYQRMYQVIRQPAPIMDRQFEIRFLDPGAEPFAFTFG
jgi:thiol-disulfide isomerase/thioredoxin